MDSVSRREFIAGAGGLVIGFALADTAIVPELLAQSGLANAPTPAGTRLDSWLRIATDGTVQVFTGKPDVGNGVRTALQQMVAEELDVPFERIAFIIGDTGTTPDQGGVTGSAGVRVGGIPLKNAAATARLVLVEHASKKLGAPIDQLQVKNGIVSVKGEESKSVSYGALMEGVEFNDEMKVTGQAFTLNVQGRGKPKDPSTYTVVGKSIPRVDLPPKIFGQFTHVNDVRVPGMLHGRIIRPATAGATVGNIDEGRAKRIPGFVKTVVEGSFVGVVAETEWAAIRAAKELQVTWNGSGTVFPPDLSSHMKSVTPKATQEGEKKGDASAALKSAAKKLEMTYEWPFQSHATMGCGCAVADVHTDGLTTVWSGAFKPHALKKGLAEILRVPRDQVRVIWVPDAGGYGRSGHEDTAADAILLSRAVGKPVRLQWMRSDMTAWGGKAPAIMMEFVAGFDAAGKVTAVQHTSRAFSGNDVHYLPDTPGNLLAGQLTGAANTTGINSFVDWVSAPDYEFPFPNVSSVMHILPPLQATGSPMRTMHMRFPQGQARLFGSESFIDELAAATGVDPVEYRLQHLTDERTKAVVSAAAERAGWDRRPSPKRTQGDAETVTGRGVALLGLPGNYANSCVATVAEVEVNRRTGVVRVKRLVCALDCGLIVNPGSLRVVISGDLVQSLSRSMKEEVTFDQNKVTSVDWNTYRVARTSDIPEVEIVLVSHPELPPGGAGEEASGPTAAAIANAIFDATGVRVRRAPFTPARVKEAIAGQQAT